jgi:hypothetical protein
VKRGDTRRQHPESEDGEHFTPSPHPERPTFYRELKPISDGFDLDALTATGIDREALIRSGADPVRAMNDDDDDDAWIAPSTRSSRKRFASASLQSRASSCRTPGGGNSC